MEPNSSKINVFEFTNPKEYLLKVFKDKQQRNPGYSLRAWAMQIGFQHHAMLSMILTNKRRLTPSMASKIRKTLDMTQDEARYFDILVQYNNAETDEEKIFYANILEDIQPQKNFSELKIDIFRYISDWHHVAIIEMTNMKDFNSDPQWIASRLGDSVSKTEVIQTIERLKRLGLLKEVDGKLMQSDERRFVSGDIPDKGIKSFHAQCLDKAKEALNTQGVHERNFQSYSMSIEKAKIPEAKKLMREFESKMANLLEAKSGTGDDVYQFNMQLFRLTENEVKNETV